MKPEDARDARFMRLALALGARHLGLTWPNPSVGAVLVGGSGAEPVILAQGITQAGGRPHAERVALDAAGPAAWGATLYVTLEPCAHHGRTPPCADAVVAAGVARVVSAMADPDPRVSGEGHARIAAAGIALTVGVLAEEASRAHRGHATRVTKGRPAVTLKLAQTADGVAGLAGRRLLITGEVANAQVHLMRAHHDAVLVGAGTLRADDPALTVRLAGLAARSPVRVVLDTHLKMSPDSVLARTARTVRTLALAGPDAPAEAERALTDVGIEVGRVALAADGRLDLGQALAWLGARGFTRLLCEGGPTLADALARDGLVDDLVLLTGSEAAGAGLPALGPHLAGLVAGRAPWCETCYGPDRVARYAF